MKKKGRNRVISALCAGIMLFSVLFFGSCTFSEGTKRSVELKLTTVEASVSTLRYVVEQFNKKNTEYRIKIEILPDSSLKDYNFSHGAIETDFISFENFTFANRLSDLLQPLTRTEAIGKYQISLINHLKTDDRDAVRYACARRFQQSMPQFGPFRKPQLRPSFDDRRTRHPRPANRGNEFFARVFADGREQGADGNADGRRGALIRGVRAGL